MDLKSVRSGTSRSIEESFLVDSIKYNDDSTKSSVFYSPPLKSIKVFKSIVNGKQKYKPEIVYPEQTLKLKTNDELDCDIQMERISHIFHTLIVKIHLAIALPTLMGNHGCILRKFFKKDMVQILLEKYKTAIGSNTSHRKSIVAYNTKITRLPSMIGTDMNMKLSEIAMELFHNAELVKYAKKLPLTDCGRDFIAGIKQLKAAIMRKMKISAAEERATFAKAVIALRRCKQLTAKIDKMQESLDNQSAEFVPKFKENENEMIFYTAEMERIKEKTRTLIHNRVVDSEASMSYAAARSDILQDRLAEKAKHESDRYEKMLADHISSEKIFRAAKFKIESQLANILIKYDLDIGERQTELEFLESLCKQNTDNIAELQIIYDAQEIIYDEYMEEKLEEDAIDFKRRYRLVLYSWAARRIQRVWRAYRARKLARKKARKAKGKGKK